MRQQQTQHLHILGYARREIGATIRLVIVALLVTLAGSALVVEIGSITLTGQAPTVATHITASVVALALGYGVVMTLLFRALLRGISQGAEWVTNEFEDATRRILHYGGNESEDSTQRVVMGSVMNAAPAPHSSERGQAERAATLDDGILTGFHAE